jgi:hypothetical protein
MLHVMPLYLPMHAMFAPYTPEVYLKAGREIERGDCVRLGPGSHQDGDTRVTLVQVSQWWRDPTPPIISL